MVSPFQVHSLLESDDSNKLAGLLLTAIGVNVNCAIRVDEN